MNLTDLFSIPTMLFITPLIVGAIYLLVFSKRGASSASVESNEILRGLIEDQKAEILKLRERSHDLANEMTTLKLQVQILTDRRDYLEQLVVTALNKEFAQDKGLAEAVKSLVRESEAATKKKL